MNAPEIRWDWGTPMAARTKDKVNLDALIPRQDLETTEQNVIALRSDGGIPISEFAIGKLHYQLLRKPHFQRETDDWDLDNVVTFIKSVRDGDLIPAVILWRGENTHTFVIDGAHRLSALIAWINDDYGNGIISHRFFKGDIPTRQVAIAKECQKLVNEEVGTYLFYSQILSPLSNTQPSPEQLRWASNVSQSIATQHVPGNADTAAKSFLAINQRSVQIDATERYMIEKRGKPNVIAARALVSRARGHLYWGRFPEAARLSIEKNAQKIYDSIFEPENADPIKNANLQPAGQAQSANGLRIALDLVHITNAEATHDVDKLEDDKSGDATARFIDVTHGVVKYISGKEHASLGLHPAVYFWGETGNHQPSIFLAVVSFVQELIAKNELVEFVLCRAKLEEFLVSNSSIGKHILGKHGGWKKSVTPVRNMLRTIFSGLKDGMTETEIERGLLQTQKFSDDYEFETERASKRLWRETKSGLRRRASLESAVRCAICKARLVIDDASDDHIVRKTEGGQSTRDNAQLTHQYCNHGFKEFFAQKGSPVPVISSPV